MKQTTIEKRMSDKAKSRFDKDLRSLAQSIYNNPIGRLMFIGEVKLSSNSSDGLFSEFSIRNSSLIPNYKEIKDKLIQKYESEEMENILSKLDSIQYLFNQ